LKFNLIKLLIFFSLLYQNQKAQYSVYDYDLVKTTFERTFNKDIISSYLNSDDETNVKAALLSIANSKDTSFIPSVIKLDFKKYGKYIAFTLGELGQSQISSHYLYTKIQHTKNKFLLRNCYNALGLVGNEKYFNLILDKTDYGVPLAFYQFEHRKIGSKNKIVLNNLFHTFLTSLNDSLKLNDLLFSLSRIGADSTFIPLLTTVLYKKDNIIGVQSKIFSLSIFNKLKYFPPLPKLFKYVLEHNDWRIRTEAAKSCTNYFFANDNELNLYFTLLYDKNPNVARQAAISIKNINVSPNLKTVLLKELDSILIDNKLSVNVIGEVFISYLRLSGVSIKTALSKYGKIISDKYLFKAVSEIPVDTKFAFNLLKSKQFNIEANNSNEFYYAVMSLQKKLSRNNEYKNFIIHNLKSGSPAAIGIISSSINDTFIKNKRFTLINSISYIIRKYRSDSNYLESLPTLVGIAKKISPSFYYQVLQSLSFSEIPYIRNFAFEKLGEKNNLKKSFNLFDDIWNFSFQYSQAKVITDKGDFIIRFLPEYAPVTVGNFCYLADKDFFNGIPFHRVVPNFVIQTGDKLGTGWGGPGYEIKSEFSPLPFSYSAVGMASAGRDTEGSQWFVMHSDYSHLNGRYTVFGQISNGKSVVDKIDVSDKILSIELIK